RGAQDPAHLHQDRRLAHRVAHPAELPHRDRPQLGGDAHPARGGRRADHHGPGRQGAAAVTAAVTASGPRTGRRRHRPAPAWLLGLIGLAGLVAVVELVPRAGLVDERYLPPCSAMLAALAEQAGTAEFWPALLEPLR